MTSVIDNEKIKKKCQIFTPTETTSFMLDLAGYIKDIDKKTVLENSCGNGEILSAIVERYIFEAKQKNKSIDEIRNSLETRIIAYEIDKELIASCKDRLNRICFSYGIENINWNIKCEDFLTATLDQKFDFIIGNPPYIAYPDLPKEIRLAVKNDYLSCEKGKFDYSYAFIEKSYGLLSHNGCLVYIIPNNIFKNVFAKKLREIILSDIIEIVDFSYMKVFDNVLTSPAIIKVVKDSQSKILTYSLSDKAKTKKYINKNELSEKWVFNISDTNGKRLGDYFKVSSSVATLCNDIFILKGGTITTEAYLLKDDRIEVELIKPAASPKNKKYSKHEEYILFPYFFDNNGKLQHYTLEKMDEKFPNAMIYLRKHKIELDKRKADNTDLFHEYGRSQAIRKVNQEMVLISSVISECTKAYLLNKEEIPYSGLYIIPIDNIALTELIEILNSDKFKKYISNVGISVSGTSKRIGPKDIENYYF